MKTSTWLIAVLATFSFLNVQAELLTTNWGGSAEMVYDEGFMHMLMKNPSGEGVSLFNMDLIENDSPGAGYSDKGVHSDLIWGRNQGRKILEIDDPRTEKAYIVFFVFRQGGPPLKFTVNGNTVLCPNWRDVPASRETYRWVEFPSSWLRRGRNVIEFSCEEASEKDGWLIYLARGDEFEHGGGDPVNVGKTSFKSTDGGRTWRESPFGTDGRDRCEYTVRISLDRHVPSGWMETPVIDLWKGDSDAFIVRQHVLRQLRINLQSDVPGGTTVEYYMRKGADPGPFSDRWEPYQLIGTGSRVDLEIPGNTVNRRFIQIRAVLSTNDPLRSPVVRSMNVSADLQEPFPVPLHRNIVVLEVDNPRIKYPSVPWEWEPWDRPEFEELRLRENTDRVIEGSMTQFEAQVRLLDYATKRWRWVSPTPEYPAWDALSIAERVDNMGGGGMCIQFNLFLGGLYAAYGWQARLVNIVAHEVCEVWNDEFGKWIYMDASTVNQYVYDPKTAEPLNMLELHDLYLDQFFPEKAIDWMYDFTGSQKMDINKQPIKRGSLATNPYSHMGFTLAAFLRMVPRNNYYEKPTPMPIAHGSSWWPWNGYINWYDERTPPKRQYTWHTDRARDMYPDLNTVRVDATQGFGSDRLFLRFETYTPNFSHFEVNHNHNGWEKTGAHWTWLLGAGRNELLVRSVNMNGVKGRPSRIVLNHANAMLGDYMREASSE